MDASYRSFLVRLWRLTGAAGDEWRGEVEQIQEGSIVDVASLEQALDVIRASAGAAASLPANPTGHPIRPTE